MNEVRVSKEFQRKLMAHFQKHENDPYSDQCCFDIVDLTCFFAIENGFRSHMLWSPYRQPDSIKCRFFNLKALNAQKVGGYQRCEWEIFDNKTTVFKRGRVPLAMTYRLPLTTECLEKFPNLVQHTTDLPHFLPAFDGKLTFLFNRNTKVIWR